METGRLLMKARMLFLGGMEAAHGQLGGCEWKLLMGNMEAAHGIQAAHSVGTCQGNNGPKWHS